MQNMNQQCILKGVLEGAQTVYPKIEPYLLEADKVVKSKIYPKIEPYLLEVDKSYKVVKSKIYPKIEPYLLKFDEVMCKCLATKETEKTKDPTSQLAKAAPAVKTSAAKSVLIAPPSVATPRPTQQPNLCKIETEKSQKSGQDTPRGPIKIKSSWLRYQDTPTPILASRK
jgi:hypothetical protein